MVGSARATDADCRDVVSLFGGNSGDLQFGRVNVILQIQCEVLLLTSRGKERKQERSDAQFAAAPKMSFCPVVGTHL